jgi:hypothetical protein
VTRMPGGQYPRLLRSTRHQIGRAPKDVPLTRAWPHWPHVPLDEWHRDANDTVRQHAAIGRPLGRQAGDLKA